MRDLNVNGGSGGIAQITITAGPTSTVGADQECSEVLVENPNANAAYLNIGAAATTAHFQLPTKVPIKVAVLNTNQINVIGTAGEKIDLLWRK